jgi:hypothetical protein
MTFIKPVLFAALTALPLMAMPAMAQNEPGSPASSAQMHANPSTSNMPAPPVAANPNGPSNAEPGAAAKNVLQNRGHSGTGD